MKRSHCVVCFLRRVIGPAADGLDEIQVRVLLHTLKVFAGVDLEAR